MNAEEKWVVMTRVKYGYVISDPFPTHTEWERAPRILRPFIGKPSDINIWSAYRMGEAAAIRRLEMVLEAMTADTKHKGREE